MIACSNMPAGGATSKAIGTTCCHCHRTMLLCVASPCSDCNGHSCGSKNETLFSSTNSLQETVRVTYSRAGRWVAPNQHRTTVAICVMCFQTLRMHGGSASDNICILQVHHSCAGNRWRWWLGQPRCHPACTQGGGRHRRCCLLPVHGPHHRAAAGPAHRPHHLQALLVGVQCWCSWVGAWLPDGPRGPGGRATV